jgi:hypothetical protein
VCWDLGYLVLNRTSESSCEQHDRGGVEEGCCRGDSSLEVLGQTAIAAEPCEEALDNPATGMDGRADLTGLLADDLDDDAGRIRHALGGVGAIGEHPLNERQQLARCPQQRDSTVTIPRVKTSCPFSALKGVTRLVMCR